MELKMNLDKNKKQTLMLAALTGLIILVLYFNFILGPQAARVAGIVVKMSKARAEFKNVKSDIASIDKLKTEMNSYREKVERYEKMLPAEQEIPSLLEDLSAMAKGSGVKIVGITPMVPKKEQNAKSARIYQEIPILINAKSGYHELGKLLSNLENSDRFMKVVDIEIKANKSTPKKHDVELLVLTYILLAGK